MIERYKISEIEEIWSDSNKFNAWLQIEKEVINFLYHQKKIEKKIYDELMSNMSFKISDIYEIEKETKHDVISFLRSISKNIDNDEAKKWIHYGLTSTDVVDTANALLLKQSNNIIFNDLNVLYKSLKNKAIKYKKIIQVGRTHGIHAEPITLGLKFAIWCDEFNRNFERFDLARKQIECGKISGATGTFANTGIKMQDYICKRLKINSSNSSTQVLQRDNHMFYFSVIANIASTIEKIATELRNLSRTEINEVNEYFSSNQKGSSAMPHKRNPIGLENICGLTRLIKTYCLTTWENNNLWHERDISHSSNERIIFLDSLSLLVYVTRRLTSIVDNLIINEKNIENNLNKTYGLIFSQSILLKIIEKNSFSREQIYDLIQKIALKCFENNLNFFDEIKKSELVNLLTTKEFNEIFDLKRHTKYIDDIYKRIFN